MGKGYILVWSKKKELWNFDLTKAFDKLDHSKVLHLCHKAGIGGYLGVCLQNWLTQRSQYVKIDVHKSPEAEAGRSCVQGSVLGPTLWIIYVNSLLVRLEAGGVDADFFAYADDLSILKHIDTAQELEEFYHILEIIQTWALEFNMIWSAAKTQRLVFKHRGCREPHPPWDIFFNGTQIFPMETRSLKTKCVSLGIVISKNLIFKEQIGKVANSMRSLSTVMKIFFHNRTEKLMIKFYWTYMIPRQINCCQVWQPMAEILLRPLNEAVKSYWKLNKARGPNGGPPPDFLEPSLHFILIDQIFVHKIYRGDSKLDFDSLFKICDSNNRQGTHRLLKLPKWRLQFSRYKLSFRAVVSFNFLPTGTRELSPTLFKEAAKLPILENRQEYLNMTLSFNIVGNKSNKEPNPVINDKLKALKKKRLNNTPNKPAGFNLGEKTPVKRSGGAKAWFPFFKEKPSTGLNLNPNTPLKVPPELTRHAFPGKIPRCLLRLQ